MIRQKQSPINFDFMPKRTCESFPQIDVFFLNKEGFLSKKPLTGTVVWNKSIAIEIFVDDQNHNAYLSYKIQHLKGEVSVFHYPIQITTTDCYFGGQRYWFKCPLGNCGKRVAVLYLAGDKFGCRNCYNLSYKSQQVTHVGEAGIWKKWFYLDRKMREKHKNFRVKFWKGKLTKKYRKALEGQMRLMRASEALNNKIFD